MGFDIQNRSVKLGGLGGTLLYCLTNCSKQKCDFGICWEMLSIKWRNVTCIKCRLNLNCEFWSLRFYTISSYISNCWTSACLRSIQISEAWWNLVIITISLNQQIYCFVNVVRLTNLKLTKESKIEIADCLLA